jgi:hypothetical protein
MSGKALDTSSILAAAVALALALIFMASQAVDRRTASAAERAQAADAARWTGLAQHYAAQPAPRQRALAADAARWTALAQHYAAQHAARQRALDADAARWTALALYYRTLSTP